MIFGHSVGHECLLSFYGDWLHIVPGLGQAGINIERLDSGISFSLSFSFFYSFCLTSVGRSGGRRGKKKKGGSSLLGTDLAHSSR